MIHLIKRNRGTMWKFLKTQFYVHVYFTCMNPLMSWMAGTLCKLFITHFTDVRLFPSINPTMSLKIRWIWKYLLGADDDGCTSWLGFHDNLGRCDSHTGWQTDGHTCAVHHHSLRPDLSLGALDRDGRTWLGSQWWSDNLASTWSGHFLWFCTDQLHPTIWQLDYLLTWKQTWTFV